MCLRTLSQPFPAGLAEVRVGFSPSRVPIRLPFRFSDKPPVHEFLSMSGDSIRSSSRSMGNTSIEKFVGTALIASEDAIAMRLLVEALEELALSVEVCTKVLAASDRVKRRKLEVVVIDVALGDQGHILPWTSARLSFEPNSSHLRNHKQQRGDCTRTEIWCRFCARETFDH